MAGKKPGTPKSRTPQPQKLKKKNGIGSTPQSAPPAPPKHKKLQQEIDDDLSDQDFEELLMDVKRKEKDHVIKKDGSEEDEDDSEDDDDWEDDDSDDDDDLDDDDDSDDDDDDDDDDEDDDEEESEDDALKIDLSAKKGQSPKRKQELAANKKTPNKPGQKTPNKKAEKPAQKRTAETAFESGVDVKSAIDVHQKCKRERDSLTLFVKNLPKVATEEQIRQLSEDIVSVRLIAAIGKKEKHRGFCFLEFESEKVAEKNYKDLQNVKLMDNILTVDFVGHKSTNPKPDDGGVKVDILKLYVSNLKESMTFEKLKKFFPKSSKIDFPQRKSDGKHLTYAFIHYTKPNLAKDAFQRLQGNPDFIVQFSVSKNKAASKKKEGKTGKPPVKKQKMTKVEVKEVDDEEDDSDEDDDDDSDEMDDDDDSDDDTSD